MVPTIKKVFSEKEIQTCLAIRAKVFMEGQGVPIEEELDGKDKDSEHYLLWVNEQPVGVARVRFIKNMAKIERVAILESHQSQGLGNTLMKTILADLKMNATIEIAKLSAQTYAISFYEKLGFVVCSNIYMDAGIPHQDMEQRLR